MKELTRVFNGTELNIEMIDGTDEFYVDVTGIAGQFNKTITDFTKRNKRIDAYIDVLGIPKSSLIQTEQGEGTRIHNKLLINFARWISPEFEVWCDQTIYDILTSQKELIIKEQQAIIDRQAQHTLVTYADGTESLRKLIRTYYPDSLSEKSTWRKLVQRGIVRYEEKTSYTKVLLKSEYGEQQQDSIRWNDNILDVLDELAEETI